MICNKSMNRSIRPLSVLAGTAPCFMLALFAAGCGERYQLGEVAQGLDQPETGSAGLFAPVIVDGKEDADADVGIADDLIGAGVGDIDGDGYDDWMSSSDSRLNYGGPRPVDGIYPAPADEGPSFALYAAEEQFGAAHTGLGDIDGDGYDDLAFGTSFGLSHFYDEGVEGPAEFAAREAVVRQRWAEQRAFLWYGGPDRSRVVHDLDQTAVAFDRRDDLASLFSSELGERLRPDDAYYEAGQNVQLSALGDIDGDGYADLALTQNFVWSSTREEQRSDADYAITSGDRVESVTYVFYGRSERFEAGLAREPDARWAGVSSLVSIGDVNGDGFGDLQVMMGSEVRLVQGRAQRLSDVPAEGGLGVPMLGALQYPTARVGDIDQDGFDDLVVLWEIDGATARHYLFYGSPSLLDTPLEPSAASALFAMPGPVVSFSSAGDWNGDGAADLLFAHARIVTDFFSPLAGVELRIVPGGAQRYSGDYELSPYRPDAAITNDNSWGGYIVGDVDGDGFADLFFTSGVGTAPTERHVFVKYGSPLPTTPAIH